MQIISFAKIVVLRIACLTFLLMPRRVWEDSSPHKQKHTSLFFFFYINSWRVKEETGYTNPLFSCPLRSDRFELNIFNPSVSKYTRYRTPARRARNKEVSLYKIAYTQGTSWSDVWCDPNLLPPGLHYGSFSMGYHAWWLRNIHNHSVAGLTFFALAERFHLINSS